MVVDEQFSEIVIRVKVNLFFRVYQAVNILKKEQNYLQMNELRRRCVGTTNVDVTVEVHVRSR